MSCCTVHVQCTPLAHLLVPLHPLYPLGVWALARGDLAGSQVASALHNMYGSYIHYYMYMHEY